jgi:hypothetical protein
MSTHQQPRSDRFLEQPNTDHLQEAKTLETSSSAPRFVAIRSVGSDGKALDEKLFVQINHDFVDIVLCSSREDKANG